MPLEKWAAVRHLSPKHLEGDSGEQFLSDTSKHSTFPRVNNNDNNNNNKKKNRKEWFYCPLGPQYSWIWEKKTPWDSLSCVGWTINLRVCWTTSYKVSCTRVYYRDDRFQHHHFMSVIVIALEGSASSLHVNRAHPTPLWRSKTLGDGQALSHAWEQQARSRLQMNGVFREAELQVRNHPWAVSFFGWANVKWPVPWWKSHQWQGFTVHHSQFNRWEGWVF